jgi:hypothetical protein
MTVHELKCWPEFFDAIEDGDKTFEVRFNDRGFQKGDVLSLCRWDNPHHCVTARRDGTYTRMRLLVTYVLSSHGVRDGFVVMGIKPMEDDQP